MKAFRIDADGVTKVDAHEGELLAREIRWERVNLDHFHDIWTTGDDRPQGGATAIVCGQDLIRLPAFVFGLEQGLPTDATLTLEQARAMIQVTMPVLGVDVCMDERGEGHIWRAVLALPGRIAEATQYLVPVPGGRRYIGVPPYKAHGGRYEELPEAEFQAEAIIRQLREGGHRTILVAPWTPGWDFARLLQDGGIRFETVEITADMMPEEDDPHGIGGDAGKEIALLADPNLREWANENGRWPGD